MNLWCGQATNTVLFHQYYIEAGHELQGYSAFAGVPRRALEKREWNR